ncbi:MAG: hypothetical protein IIZ39_03985 [Blautia sp.]|nr:hypothetical protein [Blautia sp.]
MKERKKKAMSDEKKQNEEGQNKLEQLGEEDLCRIYGGTGETKEKAPFDKDRVTRLPEI